MVIAFPGSGAQPGLRRLIQLAGDRQILRLLEPAQCAASDIADDAVNRTRVEPAVEQPQLSRSQTKVRKPVGHQVVERELQLFVVLILRELRSVLASCKCCPVFLLK